MSYATVAQLQELGAYALADLELPEDGTPEALQRLLDRATADIDGYLRPSPPADTTTLPPGWFQAGRVQWQDPLAGFALERACVEQALYRLIIGEDDLNEGTATLTSVGGVSFSGRPIDRIAPQALVAMAGIPSLWVNRTGLGVDPSDAGSS